MPPKNRKAAKVEPQAQPEAEAHARPPDLQAVVIPAAVLAVNAGHMDYINECLRVIDANGSFHGIQAASPLTLAHGARETPFCKKSYDLAMNNSGEAKFGANFFWQNFALDPLTAHVPIKKAKVQHLAGTRFRQPKHLGDVIIAMAAGEIVEDKKGQLRRLSPAEHSHAMVIAIRRDIDAGDPDTIEAWRKISLSTTMVFKIVENNEEFHWQHVQLRENPGIDFELVRHSALQRVIDIAQFAIRVKKGAKAVAKEYAEHLDLADQSEAITESFCDQAITIYNRLVLAAPRAFEMRMSLDESAGINNPLGNVSKLQCLIIKTQSKDKLEWAVGLLIDLYLCGAITKEECALAKLQGTGPGGQVKGVQMKDRKGLADVLVAKEEIQAQLHRWAAEQRAFPGNVLDTVRQITLSIQKFREHCGYSWKPGAKPSAAWKAGWPDSACQLVNAFEMIIYSSDYDSSIRDFCLSKKAVSQWLTMNPFKDILEDIAKELEKESELAGGQAEVIRVDDVMDASDIPATENLAQSIGIDSDPCLKEAVAGELGEIDVQKIERYKRQAEQLVAANVCLVHEQIEDDALAAEIKNCPAGKARGDASRRTHVLIYYDQQDCGEAQFQPHLRIPALRSKGAHIQRFHKLVIARTETPTELADGDIYVVNDAGRGGNKSLLMNSFISMSTGSVIAKKAIRPITLCIAEDSITARLDKNRGFSSIQQLQTLYFVSRAAFNLNHHDRIHCPGSTNRGNFIGPLSLDPHEDKDRTWCVALKDKLSLLGRHGPRIPVGTDKRWPEDVPEEDLAMVPAQRAKPRDKNTQEPLLYHTMPKALFGELMHSVDACACIANGADGKAALESLERNIPFFGITWTLEHTNWLRARLEGQVFKRFQDPKSKLYKVGLANLLVPKAAAAATAGGGGAAATTRRSARSNGGDTGGGGGASSAAASPPSTTAGSKSAGGSTEDILARAKALALKAAGAGEDGEESGA